MIAWKTGASALALSAALNGCAPMPRIPPVPETAAEMTGYGDPFVLQNERELLDRKESGAFLTVDDAARLALRHDPEIQAAMARVRQAQADAQQTRLWPNPVLSVAVRIPEGGGKSVIDASVTAELLSLVSRPGRISAADHRLRKSTADALTVVLDTLVTVQSQYLKAQSLAERVQIGKARQEALSELVQVIEARFNAGEATRLDVLTVQSELVSLRTELIALKSEERQARLALARMIGEPTAAADWQFDPWTKPATLPNEESEWIRAALESRPELRAVVWELAALGQDMRVAKTSVFDSGEVGVEAERDGNWSIGPAASVPLPLFDFGQAQQAMVEAKIIEQRHELTRIERQVVERVRVTFEQLRSSRQSLDVAERELVPLQEQRLEQARNAYRAGVADVLAVRVAEQDLQQALAARVGLQEQVSQAHFELVRAVGGAGIASRLPAGVPATGESSTTQPTK